jgi:hypothetical protein
MSPPVSYAERRATLPGRTAEIRVLPGLVIAPSSPKQHPKQEMFERKSTSRIVFVLSCRRNPADQAAGGTWGAVHPRRKAPHFADDFLAPACIMR